MFLVIDVPGLTGYLINRRAARHNILEFLHEFTPFSRAGIRDSTRFQSNFLCEDVSRGCDDGCMISTTRIQCKYDHRLRELVRLTGDAEYAVR